MADFPTKILLFYEFTTQPHILFQYLHIDYKNNNAQSGRYEHTETCCALPCLINRMNLLYFRRPSDYQKSEFDEAGLGDSDAEAGALADKVAVVKSKCQRAFPALQLGRMPAGLHQHAEVMQHVSGRF